MPWCLGAAELTLDTDYDLRQAAFGKAHKAVMDNLRTEGTLDINKFIIDNPATKGMAQDLTCPSYVIRTCIQCCWNMELAIS